MFSLGELTQGAMGELSRGWPHQATGQVTPCETIRCVLAVK